MYSIKKHKAVTNFKLNADLKGRNIFMIYTSLELTFKSHSVDKIPFQRETTSFSHSHVSLAMVTELK